MHINSLELLAATLAVKTFLKKASGISVLLQLDNATAVAYINNMGGTVSSQLTELAKELWMWALDRNLTLVAQHIPGLSNTIADAESRTLRDRSDWMLCPQIFQTIKKAFGPLDVDLFASRLTHQLPCFFSWRPDPLAEAVDAFQQDWGRLKGFANPPLVPDRQSPEPSTSPASSASADSTSVEGPDLVPSAPGNVVGLSQTNCLDPGSDSVANRLPDGDGPSTSRVACLREIFSSSCLSEEATKLLLQSWRSKSAQSYDSHFRKWASWCAEGVVILFQDPPLT